MNIQKRRLKILVLGGNGFIGRQVVANLVARADVVIGTRQKTVEKGNLTLQMQQMSTVDTWRNVLQDFDMVVNCVGILRERKNESFYAVHTAAVAALAQTCSLFNINLIHVSAIGLTDRAGSRFVRSKLAGEQAIVSSGANAVIVRPSLLDGEGGYGAKWFRRVANWPIQFVMQTNGLVAPLQVKDLGVAIANLVWMQESKRPKIVEVGGVDAMSFSAYLRVLRKANALPPALQISVPKLLVRLVSHIFDLLAWTPLSFGHYELMQGYNVPRINLLPTLLGRQPAALGKSIEIMDEMAVSKG